MKFSIDKQDKFTIVKPEFDKIDSTVSPDLKTEFITLNAEGAKNILLDLSEVKYVDSSGLSSILVANRLCGQKNGALVLAAVQPHVEKLITISQLNDVLNILPTVEEAKEAIFLYELENNIKGSDPA